MSSTATKRPALGKGLDALIPGKNVDFSVQNTVKNVVSDGKPMEIGLELIDPSPYQTRKAMDAGQLDELARSIAATGVVQPVIVRAVAGGRYQLIAGERRWRASKQAKRETVPAIVRQVSDEQAMEMTIVENLQRADLNAMEQARAYERLSREFKMTQEQMAARTGKDRASVGNFMRLLKLPEAVQAHVEAGSLSFGHGKALLALEDEEEILKAALKVVNLNMSVRQTEAMIQGLIAPKPKKVRLTAEDLRDPNVRDAETRIQQLMGLKVRIEDKGGMGRVVIEYHDLQDFDVLLTQLLK